MSSFNLLKPSVFIKTRTFIILFLLQETRGDRTGAMQNADGRNSTTNLIRKTNHDRQDEADFNYNFHLIHNEKSEVSNRMLFKESTDEFANFKRFKRADKGGLLRDEVNGKLVMEFNNSETEILKTVDYENLHANQSFNNSNSYSTLDLSVIGSPLKDVDAFTTENWAVTDGYFVANTTECPDLYRDPELCNMTKEEYTNTILEYIYPSSYELIFIVTYAIVFVIGLVGNALVCVAVYRNHSMRTVTNYFIVNLAVADFMVILICLPSTVIWDVTKTWFFGNALCRIILYFQSVSVTVSVLTLTFISVDRWYAICFPLKFKSTTGRAKTAILIIWLLSLSFNVPEFVVLEVSRQTGLRFDLQYFMQCAPTWSKDSDLKWHIIKAIFLYTFPLLLMMIAYCQIVRVLWRSDNIPGHSETNSCTGGQNNMNRRNTMSIHANASTEGQLRSRRKAAKMLVAVVVMFAVCYLPVHVLSVLRYAFDMPQTNFITFVSLMSHVLCYVNSAINPLIYNFMSGKFRREFHRSFFNWPCWCCGAPTSERNGASFAPIGSSRAGTSRTIIRRNDSCVSYRLTHLSPSNNCNSLNRTTNTSFIENNNSGNTRKINNRFRDHSTSDNAARLTLTSDIKD